MFVLKKVVTLFLLPPGGFVALLFMSGLWFLAKKHFRAAGINLLLGGLLWLSAVTPVTHIMFKGLESGLEIPQSPQGDVIILLGGGAYHKVPDMTGLGTPSDSALRRVVTVARLQKRLAIPVIVSGGKAFGYQDVEAQILRRFLSDLGVPADQIILEQESRDTIENALYTKKICETFGFEEPLLVTSAYHMKRSMMSFRKAGMAVSPFPAGFRSSPDRQYGWIDYLPHDPGDFAVAAKEYLGLFFYKVVY